jgi:hypothetical protein
MDRDIDLPGTQFFLQLAGQQAALRAAEFAERRFAVLVPISHNRACREAHDQALAGQGEELADHGLSKARPASADDDSFHMARLLPVALRWMGEHRASGGTYLAAPAVGSSWPVPDTATSARCF